MRCSVGMSRAALAELLSLRDAPARAAAGACVVSSWRALSCASRAGATLLRVYSATSAPPGTLSFGPRGPPPVSIATPRFVERASGLASVSDDAAVGVVALPPRLSALEAARARACTLYVDGVSDPTNVGTLLRTAAVFKFAAVLARGSADPFSDRAVRAGAGGQWSVPLARVSPDDGALADASLADVLDAVVACGTSAPPAMRKPPRALHVTLLADARAEMEASDVRHALSQIRSTGRAISIALVLGNEARGLSASWLSHDDAPRLGLSMDAHNDFGAASCMRLTVRVRVGPRAASVESLNVAAAGSILMHLCASAVRQRRID